MKKIEIVQFTNNNGEYDVDFDMLNASFIRYMGRLDADDIYIEYITVCTEIFTEAEAKLVMIEELKDLLEDDYSIGPFDVADIKQFIKKLKK